MTFRVAPCTGVAIPEPSTPDITSRFQYPYRQAKPITKSVQLVKALQSLHQLPTRLAQLIDWFFRSRNSTLMLFITSLDKQSERYCTDRAVAV
jgi:hypothetical protein